MSSSSLQIRLETDGDGQVLSQLAAAAFGPGRFARTAYRVRQGIAPVAALCLAAWLDDRLVGGIRFTAIRIGEEDSAALLGPLVVDPAENGKGLGRALMEEGLSRARAEGFGLVLLVGDLPYYGRFGFVPVPFGQITLPGPVDPNRLLALELTSGALARSVGPVKAYAR
ncbi:MAG: N-acetyltransferase [Methyloceanibacter sp.]|jgi:predicted N-acetyltransferase YhbS|nr:N-acetyltransferase [Methyloceanibacter sp.]